MKTTKVATTVAGSKHSDGGAEGQAAPKPPLSKHSDGGAEGQAAPKPPLSGPKINTHLLCV
jgi:hypothetical protein